MFIYCNGGLVLHHIIKGVKLNYIFNLKGNLFELVQNKCLGIIFKCKDMVGVRVDAMNVSLC